MKRRSFFLALGVTVLILLSISLGGLVWLVAQSPLSLLNGAGVTSPEGAMFVPKQSPAMVSLLVNPEKLEAFRVAIAPPGIRRQARDEITGIKQSLLAGRGLTYEEDIHPWLGDEITFAVTTPDLDRDASNGRQPGYLLILAANHPQRAREFLQLFWQKRAIGGTDLVFEQYAGVKLIYSNETRSPASGPKRKKEAPAIAGAIPGLASAVVGDRFVLFANSPKVLREAINTVQAPDLSLKRNPTYQEAIDRLTPRQIGVTFVNLPQFGQWLNEGNGLTQVGSEPSPDKAERLFESLVVGLGLARQGLVADTALLTAAGQTLTPSKPALAQPVGALQYIPATTPFSASGVKLQALWSQLSSGLSDYGVLSALVAQPINALQTQWGVTFSDELLNWVDREFALGLVPRPDAPADWVFVAEKTPETPAALEKLDAIAQAQGLSIGPIELGSQKTYAWTRLQADAANRKKSRQPQPAPTLQVEVEGVHTTVGQYEVFATSIDAINQALSNSPASLLKSSEFQRAIAPIAAENDGYLYIDWLAVKDQLEQQFPILRLAELSAKPFFDHVRSLTISSYGSEARVRRGAVFIQLQDA